MNKAVFAALMMAAACGPAAAADAAIPEHSVQEVADNFKTMAGQRVKIVGGYAMHVGWGDPSYAVVISPETKMRLAIDTTKTVNPDLLKELHETCEPFFRRETPECAVDLIVRVEPDPYGAANQPRLFEPEFIRRQAP